MKLALPLSHLRIAHSALERKSLLMKLGLPDQKKKSPENTVGFLLMSADDLASYDAISTLWCYDCVIIVLLTNVCC